MNRLAGERAATWELSSTIRTDGYGVHLTWESLIDDENKVTKRIRGIRKKSRRLGFQIDVFSDTEQAMWHKFRMLLIAKNPLNLDSGNPGFYSKHALLSVDANQYS